MKKGKSVCAQHIIKLNVIYYLYFHSNIRILIHELIELQIWSTERTINAVAQLLVVRTHQNKGILYTLAHVNIIHVVR